MIKSLAFAVALTALLSGSALAHDAPGGGDGAKVTLVYDHKLPNVPGKSMKGVLVEYTPGGFSEGHTHPVSAFIYATVLEGAIRSQVNDGPVTVYSAGESWNFRAIATVSAKTPARLSRQSSSLSSWSIPLSRN